MTEVKLSDVILAECARRGLTPDVAAIRALDRLEAPKGCGKRFAAGQWWGFCGETDMGQTEPALCEGCGGKYKLAT
jgi:hypothetical protein